MPRRFLDRDVFSVAVARMVAVYEQGHRVVVSFSGGKDSTVTLEICRIAARMTNRLPVEVMMRDEEILFPGSFEYCERVYNDPEVQFDWLVAHQPIVNVCNRAMPYYWVFDPLLRPQQWMRPMPPWAKVVPEQNISGLITHKRYPPPEGKHLYNTLGLRASESNTRNYSIHSSRGYLTWPDRHGVGAARPIYDWADTDIWKAIGDNGWDYNSAYDAFMRIGMKAKELRIAPVALLPVAWKMLQLASKIWPQWYDALTERLPGTRQVAMFGRRALLPMHRPGELWQTTFFRECIDEAPGWIRERSQVALEKTLAGHERHSVEPFPEQKQCNVCGKVGSWYHMTTGMYAGDPFSMVVTELPYLEPEAMRAGAGRWDGKPTW